jgi:hypothetical protein
MEKPEHDPIVDVQNTLDEWLANNPDVRQYVTKIFYLPDGAEIPRAVSHLNRLTSVDHPDLDLRLGVVATLSTTAIANVILAILERADAREPDPKE